MTRGKQGRYDLTPLGLSTAPLLVELGRLGRRIDPSTQGAQDLDGALAELAGLAAPTA